VHQDIVISPQMLVASQDEVVLLPAATRYEQRGGGTETTTERRILFSPEIPGPRIGEARAEWEIFVDLAARIHPERAAQLRFADADEIRREIARVVPSYAGIERLKQSGDHLQWGGARLCEGGIFPTPDGRARIAAIDAHPVETKVGWFRLSSRRGKQFNSMTFADRDPLTGAGRDAVFMSREDASRLGLSAGAPVRVRSETGAVTGRVHLAPIRAGNVQMFFPEANALIPSGPRDPRALIPDYNVDVQIESR